MEGKSRIGGLDSLRGSAVLLVIAYHYDENRFYYGLLGVELFFIISGFVILMTIEKVRSIAEFAWHRAGRLYPAYWLSVLLASAVLLHRVSLGEVLTNLTMLQAFAHQPNLIDPYWTLGYEIWFYAVVAAIFAFGKIKHIDRIALIWLIAMIVCRGGMLVTGHGFNIFYLWFVRLLLMPMFGQLFIAGMMLYRMSTSRSNAATIIALALAVLYSFFGRPDWTQISPAVYFSVNLVFIGSVWIATRTEIFSFTRLGWIGRCSYSLYLLHIPIFMLIGYKLAAVPIIFAVAALSWHFIEVPAQRWARRRWAV